MSVDANETGWQPTVQWARSHIDALAHFPEGEFTHGALDHIAQTHFQDAKDHGVFIHISTYKSRGTTKSVWRVKRRVLDHIARDYDENEASIQMPCTHYGYSWPEGSDYRVCTKCGGRFTRDEVVDVNNTLG